MPFENSKNLKHFDLTQNQLTFLPEIGELKKLENSKILSEQAEIAMKAAKEAEKEIEREMEKLATEAGDPL